MDLSVTELDNLILVLHHAKRQKVQTIEANTIANLKSGQDFVSFDVYTFPGIHCLTRYIQVKLFAWDYYHHSDWNIYRSTEVFDDIPDIIPCSMLSLRPKLKDRIMCPPKSLWKDGDGNNPATVKIKIPIYLYWNPEEYPSYNRIIHTINTSGEREIWEVYPDYLMKVNNTKRIQRTDWPSAGLYIYDKFPEDPQIII